MQYLCWRVLAGLNDHIEVCFMLFGHTKFAAFGLWKQKFRRTSVGCLNDLVCVVNSSSVVNHAQLVRKEDGTILVNQYNWSGYFSPYFRRAAFDGIKSLHHLVFSKDTPGQVMVRKATDGEQSTLNVLTKDHLRWKPSASALPEKILPPGNDRCTC